MPQRHELRLPDLGLPGHEATVSLWLVEPGSEVVEGDRVVEVLVANATVDLPAPASGVLEESFVDEDEPVAAGQLLGIVVEDGEPTADDK
jgi:pyruvate/2-oxoglutarate dehydrogenase complex dihydrolipoamide acyltransferase (E2) component